MAFLLQMRDKSERRWEGREHEREEKGMKGRRGKVGFIHSFFQGRKQ